MLKELTKEQMEKIEQDLVDAMDAFIRADRGIFSIEWSEYFTDGEIAVNVKRKSLDRIERMLGTVATLDESYKDEKYNRLVIRNNGVVWYCFDEKEKDGEQDDR